jgi:hypothetical protein
MPMTLDMPETPCLAPLVPLETERTHTASLRYEGFWATSGTLENIVEVDRIAANPINYTDPSGLLVLDPKTAAWIAGQAGSAAGIATSTVLSWGAVLLTPFAISGDSYSPPGGPTITMTPELEKAIEVERAKHIQKPTPSQDPTPKPGPTFDPIPPGFEPKVDHDPDPDKKGFVPIYKAPKTCSLGLKWESVIGFEIGDFEYDPTVQGKDGNAYFAKERALAMEWHDTYSRSGGGGILEVDIPTDDYKRKWMTYEAPYLSNPKWTELIIPRSQVIFLNLYPRHYDQNPK